VARDTRGRLLDATVAVIGRAGAQGLTLEAVAAQAGVSKGGLLYHFASKRELLDALLGRWMDEFEADVERDTDGVAVGYVRACDGTSGDERALIGAIAAEPEALAPVRERYAELQDRVAAEGGVDATVARLAADGLWLADLLGLGPLHGELRERVLERLVILAAAPAARSA
jgi:AcrR family transcriptional regulator